jgi:hypothetical protein
MPLTEQSLDERRAALAGSVEPFDGLAQPPQAQPAPLEVVDGTRRTIAADEPGDIANRSRQTGARNGVDLEEIVLVEISPVLRERDRAPNAPPACSEHLEREGGVEAVEAM